MSVNQAFRNNFYVFKAQLANKLEACSMDVESLLAIDVSQLPITKLLFQFIVAIVAVLATFTELVLYLGKNTLRTIFITQ